MTKFPASKKSNSRSAGFLNARLEKRKLMVSTSIRLSDGRYQSEETEIRPPCKIRIRIASALFGPYKITKGEKADYSLMVGFEQASAGWECPDDYDEGIKIEIEIEDIGRVTLTSAQASVRNLIWNICQTYYETAPEYRSENFVFVGWKCRVNPVSGRDFGELQLERDMGQADGNGGTPPPPRSPFGPKRSGPDRDTPKDDDKDDLNDAIPF
jgi:hypothetical protein